MATFDELDDNSKMPWGKYEGTTMANVPASYLLWLYDNNKRRGNVLRYIINNMDVIKNEVKDNTNKK